VNKSERLDIKYIIYLSISKHKMFRKTVFNSKKEIIYRIIVRIANKWIVMII